MSERITRPADALKVGWRTDPGGNPIAEPPVAKQADGYAYKEEVPSEELNWEMKLWGDLLLWLMGYVPREWTTLKEGIDNTTAPGRFVVVPNTGASLKRQNAIFTAATALGYPPIWSVTDCRWIYYIDANAAVEGQNVIAVHPETGVLEWSKAKGYTAITGLACDGERVYSTESGMNGVDVRNVDTGVISAHGGAASALHDLATNGEYLVGVAGNTLAFFNALATTPAETGTVTVGADTFQVAAVDADQVYAGGAFVSNPFRAYNLFSRAAAWAVSPLTTTVPAALAVATDGDVVYFGTGLVTLTAGGDRNLFAYDRATGQLLASFEVGTNSDDVVHLALDDQYLYVTTRNSSGGIHREIHVLTRPGGGLPQHQLGLYLVSGGDAQAWDADGLATVIGVGTSGSGALLRRSHYHIKSREYQRVTDDPGRAPWGKAAIPI